MNQAADPMNNNDNEEEQQLQQPNGSYRDDEHVVGNMTAVESSMPREAIISFPARLHFVLSELEKDGMDHIASWQPHGRCFKVHRKDEFVDTVLRPWFRQSQYPSFQRQLNIYGFRRIAHGPDKSSYYHELFLRGRPFLSHQIVRNNHYAATTTAQSTRTVSPPNF